MNTVKNHLNKYWHIWVLMLIMLGAFFIHIWHFQDWLIFTSDQARDAYSVKEAFDNGFSHLRLLGPKIGMAHIKGDLSSKGDTFHLGPFYYYLQYLSAKTFKSVQPWAIAFPDLLMFILSIPLFYYLNIHFFSKKISLFATALFAFSFFNLLYSKFAWNPNQLFFWEILLILSLSKITLTTKKMRGRWLVLAVLSFLIISQLHFLAFVIFSIFSLVFLSVYRPIKIPLKYWLVSFFLVLIFTSPIFISDLKNNSDNFKRFSVAITQKEDNSRPFLKRVSKTYDRVGSFFSFDLTSFNEKEIDSIENLGGMFFILSIFFTISIFAINFKSFPFLKKQTPIIIARHQKLLLFIILLWIICFFVVFFKIYEKLDNARYFIIVSPLVFIIIGFWFSLLEKFKIKKLGNSLIFLMSALLLFFNFQATYSFYDALLKGGEPFKFNRELKLEPYNELITFGEMNDAFNYMKAKSFLENKILCLNNSNYQYNSGFEYINDISLPIIFFDHFKTSDKYSNCIYFVAGKTKRTGGDVNKDFLINFKIIDKKSFGALTVWRLELKERIRNREIKLKEKTINPKDNQRKRAEIWSELFQNPPYKKLD